MLRWSNKLHINQFLHIKNISRNIMLQMCKRICYTGIAYKPYQLKCELDIFTEFHTLNKSFILQQIVSHKKNNTWNSQKLF